MPIWEEEGEYPSCLVDADENHNYILGEGEKESQDQQIQRNMVEAALYVRSHHINVTRPVSNYNTGIDAFDVRKLKKNHEG